MLTSPLLQIISAAAGLLVGSIVVFLAPRVVAYRLTEPEPLPPPTVLIPVVGIWLTRWRARYNLGLEVLMAAVFVALSLRYGGQSGYSTALGRVGPDVALGLAALYSTILIAIGYIDLDHRLVLNRLSYPGTVLALAVGAARLWPGLDLVSALIGAGVGLVIFVLFQLFGRGALGTGDTKLALLIGAMRGYPGVLDALLLGVVLGGIGALFFLVVLRRGRREYIAYAPYLAAGAIVSFFISR
jgi:prepilin signal peptidase PulO-like enzyme (type II secretory pathway)